MGLMFGLLCLLALVVGLFDYSLLILDVLQMVVSVLFGFD